MTVVHLQLLCITSCSSGLWLPVVLRLRLPFYGWFGLLRLLRPCGPARRLQFRLLRCYVGYRVTRGYWLFTVVVVIYRWLFPVRTFAHIPRYTHAFTGCWLRVLPFPLPYGYVWPLVWLVATRFGICVNVILDVWLFEAWFTTLPPTLHLHTPDGCVAVTVIRSLADLRLPVTLYVPVVDCSRLLGQPLRAGFCCYVVGYVVGVGGYSFTLTRCVDYVG